MAVLVMRIHTFCCDVDRCFEWSPDYWPPSSRGSQIAAARRKAEADGWSFEPIDPRGRRVSRSDPANFARCPAHTQQQRKDPS